MKALDNFCKFSVSQKLFHSKHLQGMCAPCVQKGWKAREQTTLIIIWGKRASESFLLKVLWWGVFKPMQGMLELYPRSTVP